MKNVRLSLLLASMLTLGAGAAQAQSRVFVSARTGSDANTCSNIATPCQTLQGAVNQVAAGGSVLVLDTGGYGPLSIAKSVSIEAPPGIEAFIHPPSGSAITVLAGAGDIVVLRGLTLSVGPLYGIDFIQGGALHVERCVIQGFQSGISALRGSGTVVSDLYVEDTVVRGCSIHGISVMALNGLVRAVIDGCTLEGNGSFGLSSAADFGSSCEARTVVRETVASGNSLGLGVGSYGTGRIASLIVDGCTVSSNTVAGLQADSLPNGSSTLRYANSVVTGNGGTASINWAGVRQSVPAQAFSRQDSTVEGNAHDFSGTVGTYTPK
jgi:hypothetical protein